MDCRGTTVYTTRLENSTTQRTALAMTSEKTIQTEILLDLGARGELRIWRNNTGAARIGNHFIRFGVKGQADISGIALPAGRRIEIEVKRPGGRQSQDQKNFQRMIEKHGGLYIIATSVIDARTQLQQAGIISA